MENILKNKLLIILVLFTILINIICLSVFASEIANYTYSCTYAGKNLNINVSDFEGYSRHLVSVVETDGYLTINVYYFNGDVTFSSRDAGLFINVPEGVSICQFSNSSSINDFYSGTTWSFPGSLNGTTREGSAFFSVNTYHYNQAVKTFYGQANVLDNEGNVVFQGAPQEQEEITNPTNPEEEITSPVVQVELMKPTQVQEILPQIMAVVGIVLPTLLTIFGVLLVLYLIKSKNLLHL